MCQTDEYLPCIPKSYEDLSVESILDVLKAWEDGRISTERVYSFGEVFYSKLVQIPGRKQLPKSDQRTIQDGVVELLDRLYIDPIIKEDIPAIRTFLLLGQVSPKAAWEYHEVWASSIDWNARDCIVQRRINNPDG